MYKVRRRIFPFLLMVISISLSAQDFSADRDLLDAYLRNDMKTWKGLIDTASTTAHTLAYEYGYCAALMDVNKTAAQPYVARFRKHVEGLKGKLSPGHYEMYMSAVYVYELRLHESFHPAKSLSLARESVKKAPSDPLTLTYCGMALFYAPKPFGDKKEALQLFLKAERLFATPKWKHCWWRAAAMMYIAQCYDKQGEREKAIAQCETILTEYPSYAYIRDTYLPGLRTATR